MDNSTATGYLQVKVSSADGAFPVEGAIVLISPNMPEDNGVIYSRRTDSSGLTDTIPLETKPRALSESPGTEPPFLSYNVQVKKDGYYVSNIMNVPIFEGITATLPVNMVPMSRDSSHYDNDFEQNGSYNYLHGGRLYGGQNEQ